MGCWRNLCNIDPDDIFAYNTIKTVKIRDRYLGFLRLLLLVGIFVYIVVKVIIIDKAYNIHDTPIGFVRTSLMFPGHGVDMEKLVYCPNSVNHNTWPFPSERSFPCRVWDANSIVYPADEVNSMFITTRVTETEEEYSCGNENTVENPTRESQCNLPYKTVNSNTYFLGGVEDYTIGIQHSFVSKLGKRQTNGNSKSYAGKLRKVDKSVTKVFDLQQNSDTPDVQTLGELLDAAGASIYAKSRDPANSMLYSGMVVIVMVRYTNEPDIRYEYIPQLVPQADYKLFEVRYDGLDIQRRQTFKRAGPKFIFLVSGDMVKFDFQQLLVQLVSALGLQSIATLVVELVMLYIMPLRDHYNNVKYEVTEDFSHLRRFNTSDASDTDHVQNDLNTSLQDIRETGTLPPSDTSYNNPAYSANASKNA